MLAPIILNDFCHIIQINRDNPYGVVCALIGVSARFLQILFQFRLFDPIIVVVHVFRINRIQNTKPQITLAVLFVLTEWCQCTIFADNRFMPRFTLAETIGRLSLFFELSNDSRIIVKVHLPIISGVLADFPIVGIIRLSHFWLNTNRYRHHQASAYRFEFGDIVSVHTSLYHHDCVFIDYDDYFPIYNNVVVIPLYR